MDPISLLVPTRKRPDNVKRLISSAVAHAAHPEKLEFVFYVDDDDDSYDFDEIRRETVFENITVLRGPRIVLSEMWNRCWEVAKGPYFFHMGDDIVFRTHPWDLKFTSSFMSYPDKILFVHGNDGGPNGRTFGTHGMIHANWCNTVGYFVPPYFSSDFNDTWLNDVANGLGRRVYVDVLTEHMHFVFGKAPIDQTHQERLERHARDNCDALYLQLQHERDADCDKLRAFIASVADSHPDSGGAEEAVPASP